MTLEGGGPNAGATIFNVSLLLSGIFQLLGGLLVLIGVHPDKDTTRDNLIATFTYVGVTVLTGISYKHDFAESHPCVLHPGGRPDCFTSGHRGNCNAAVWYFRPSVDGHISLFQGEDFVLVIAGFVSFGHRSDISHGCQIGGRPDRLAGQKQHVSIRHLPFCRGHYRYN